MPIRPPATPGYEIIADRDRGDDPYSAYQQVGDRLTYTRTAEGSSLDRIERPLTKDKQGQLILDASALQLEAEIGQPLNSIEDMEFGALFTARLLNGDGAGRTERWMRINSCHPVARMRDGLHRWARHFDSYSITDVVPPTKETR